MKKVIAVLFILIMCASLVACQPTPNKPIVVSKGDGNMENAIFQGAPEGYTYSVGTGFAASAAYLDNKLNIELSEDCKVNFTDKTAFPIYRAFEREIGNAFISDVIERICGKECNLYLHDDRQTKEQLRTLELVPLQRVLWQIENDLPIDNSDVDVPNFNKTEEQSTPIYDENGNIMGFETKTVKVPKEEQIAFVKNMIKTAEARIEAAPEVIEPKPVAFSDISEKITALSIDITDGKTKSQLYATDEFVTVALDGDFLFQVAGTNIQVGFSSVKADADAESKKATDEFIQKLGATDMTLAHVGMCVQDAKRPYNVYVYTRSIEGIGTTVDEDMTVCGRFNPSMSESHGYEFIAVYVDSNTHGILSFTWNAPMNVSRVQSSVVLMPFCEFTETPYQE